MLVIFLELRRIFPTNSTKITLEVPQKFVYKFPKIFTGKSPSNSPEIPQKFLWQSSRNYTVISVENFPGLSLENFHDFLKYARDLFRNFSGITLRVFLEILQGFLEKFCSYKCRIFFW